MTPARHSILRSRYFPFILLCVRKHSCAVDFGNVLWHCRICDQVGAKTFHSLRKGSTSGLDVDGRSYEVIVTDDYRHSVLKYSRIRINLGSQSLRGLGSYLAKCEDCALLATLLMVSHLA